MDSLSTQDRHARGSKCAILVPCPPGANCGPDLDVVKAGVVYAGHAIPCIVACLHRHRALLSANDERSVLDWERVRVPYRFGLPGGYRVR